MLYSKAKPFEPFGDLSKRPTVLVLPLLKLITRVLPSFDTTFPFTSLICVLLSRLCRIVAALPEAAPVFRKLKGWLKVSSLLRCSR